MLIVEGCECDFCTSRVMIVPFDLIRPLVAEAAGDRVCIKPTDTVFVIDGVRAVACVRIIRRNLSRLCGCWVANEFRRTGIGSELVRARIAYIESHTGARAIDTYAFRRRLFLRLGFEERKSFKIGTTLLRKSVPR